MVQAFNCEDTRALYEGRSPPRFKIFLAVAQRKLAHLEAAQTPDFLRAPPGNRLEALKGNRPGSYNVCIDDPWRICFAWSGVGPVDVEIAAGH